MWWKPAAHSLAMRQAVVGLKVAFFFEYRSKMDPISHTSVSTCHERFKRSQLRRRSERGFTCPVYVKGGR
jgi:hypothetical protein